ncbi:MAG: response regulator transcription factor [Verrucomicrobia bacterium]|nr:response regulator transcription factor [Verrucomicrobiota bacterium]
MRVLVADDHEMVRRGLRAVVENQPGWLLCGEATTGREAVERALELKPDVVVMDLSMPELHGLEATRRIRRELPQTEVLILTMHDSERLVREVLAVGAKGFVLKSDAGHVLVRALESVGEHRPYFTSKFGELMISGYLHSAESLADEGETLSPREREIVQLVCEGKSSKDIAVALDLSTKTVETHRANIHRKLRLRSVSELVRYAIRNQIIEA